MITGVVVIRAIIVVVMPHLIVVGHVIRVEISRSGDRLSRHRFTNTLVFFCLFYIFYVFNQRFLFDES